MRILKSVPPWLVINLIAVMVPLSCPDLAHAVCPPSHHCVEDSHGPTNRLHNTAPTPPRSTRKSIPNLNLIKSRVGTTPLNVEVAEERKKIRCPRNKHPFKGRCLDNSVLDGLEVCNDNNCTQDCAGCAKGTVSCYPRPDDQQTYVCIDCMSNKNCRKGFTCDQYRCVPRTAAAPQAAPAVAANQSPAPVNP